MQSTHTSTGRVMQKFPLRNRGNNRHPNDAFHGGNRNRYVKRNRSPREITQPQRMQRIRQPLPAAAAHQSSTTKPTTGKICSRVFTKEADNLATWDEVLSVGCKSKSLLSPVSSSLVDSNAVMVATTQEPVEQTLGEILEVVPCNATAAATATASGNNIANGNRNKDDDDNNRRSRQQRTTALPAASVREFMTFERLRLGDQINFLLFDPYRTLKFLITELKSRLRAVVPDDINVQKILVEIQQTMKRIRIPNVTESLPPLPLRTATPTAGEVGPKTATATPVECILPKERCHVIKEDPLINHARKVNSSCQTIALQLENVNACQMCEHQVKQGAVGCNQKRMNGNSNVEDAAAIMMMVDVTGTHQRSKDHRKDMEMEMYFSCRSLQDAIANLKIKSNPFSDDTQKIITQLETELSNFQCKLQRTTSSTSSSLLQRPLGMKSTTEENLKVQCKRLLDEEAVQDEDEEQVFLDFIAKSPSLPLMYLDSATQAGATTISKQSQTNIQSPTQMLCHLEKEKLLLLQQFRTSEMQTIQGDLNELHAFIKDQLDGIYHSITRENQNFKYHSNDKGGRPYNGKKNHRQKISRALQGPEKTTKMSKMNKTEKTPTAASSASLAVPTSSVLSLNEVGVTTSTGSSSIATGHYKKSSPSPIAGDNDVDDDDNGNANNTKSIMKQRQQQKSSSSSLSTADAKENHDISDVDKANKAFGEKNSNDSYRRRRHNLCCADVDTPFCTGKKINFTAVECEGCCCPHTRMDDDDDDNKVQKMMTADAARTSTHCDIKSAMKTSPATMTCHQHRQQCHQQPMTTMTTTTTTAMTSAAQEQTQLISSAAVPSYITVQSATDETALNPDTVTNARVKTIIGTTRTAAEHSDGIRRMHKQHHCRRRQSYQSHNSWQRVNLKNPTGCQLEKQICGDGYECRINNNSDNRSNYPEIHDCQKCRANSINPSGGLRSAKMHEVGTDNAAAAATGDDGHGGRNDGSAGGDGPIYWSKGNGTEDFTCHIGQHEQAEKPHSRRYAAKAAFQTDLEEFKEFLDEIIISTPRLK